MIPPNHLWGYHLFCCWWYLCRDHQKNAFQEPYLKLKIIGGWSPIYVRVFRRWPPILPYLIIFAKMDIGPPYCHRRSKGGSHPYSPKISFIPPINFGLGRAMFPYGNRLYPEGHSGKIFQSSSNYKRHSFF